MEKKATPKKNPAKPQPFVLPFTCGGLTVLSLGRAIADAGYMKRVGQRVVIFPVGYKIARPVPSLANPDVEVPCTAEIEQGASGPIFTIVCSDAPAGQRYSGSSASGVWQDLVSERRPGKVISVNGLFKFGLSIDAIADAIGELEVGVAPSPPPAAATAAPVSGAACPHCKLDAPFCAVTGAPHPCKHCGLNTPFCAVLGVPHESLRVKVIAAGTPNKTGTGTPSKNTAAASGGKGSAALLVAAAVAAAPRAPRATKANKVVDVPSQEPAAAAALAGDAAAVIDVDGSSKAKPVRAPRKPKQVAAVTGDAAAATEGAAAGGTDEAPVPAKAPRKPRAPRTPAAAVPPGDAAGGPEGGAAESEEGAIAPQPPAHAKRVVTKRQRVGDVALPTGGEEATAAGPDGADGIIPAPDAGADGTVPKPAKAPRREKKAAGAAGGALRQTTLLEHTALVPAAAPEVPKGPPPLRPLLCKRDTGMAKTLCLQDPATVKLATDAAGKSKSALSRYLQFLWMYTSERCKADFVRRKPTAAGAAAGGGAPAEVVGDDADPTTASAPLVV